MSKNELISYPEVNLTIDELKNDLKPVVSIETELNENLTPVELSEEEQLSLDKEIAIQKLKDSKIKYHPKKDFGIIFKAKRKRKNNAQKKSRKANR